MPSDQLVHHLRQAEADLTLARSSVGLALVEANHNAGADDDWRIIKLAAVTLEVLETQLGAIRRRHQ